MINHQPPSLAGVFGSIRNFEENGACAGEEIAREMSKEVGEKEGGQGGPFVGEEESLSAFADERRCLRLCDAHIFLLSWLSMLLSVFDRPPDAS